MKKLKVLLLVLAVLLIVPFGVFAEEATDVTEEFLARFNPLFNRFVKPVKHPLYVSEED